MFAIFKSKIFLFILGSLMTVSGLYLTFLSFELNEPDEVKININHPDLNIVNPSEWSVIKNLFLQLIIGNSHTTTQSTWINNEENWIGNSGLTRRKREVKINENSCLDKFKHHHFLKDFDRLKNLKISSFDDSHYLTNMSQSQNWALLLDRVHHPNKIILSKSHVEMKKMHCSGCSDSLIEMLVNSEGKIEYRYGKNGHYYDSNCNMAETKKDNCLNECEASSNVQLSCSNHSSSFIDLTFNNNAFVCNVDNYNLSSCKSKSENFEEINFVITENKFHMVKSLEIKYAYDPLEAENYIYDKLNCGVCFVQFNCEGDDIYKRAYHKTGQVKKENCHVNYNHAKTKLMVYDYVTMSFKQVTCIGKGVFKIGRPSRIVRQILATSNNTLQAACVKGVISVLSQDRVISQYKLCSGFKCVSDIVGSKKLEINLPNESKVRRIKHKLSIYYDEFTIVNKIIVCEPVNICETLECTFCLMTFMNPHCYEVVHYLFIMIMLSLLGGSLSFTIYTINKSTRFLVYIVKSVLFIIKRLYKMLRYGVRLTISTSKGLNTMINKRIDSESNEVELEEVYVPVQRRPPPMRVSSKQLFGLSIILGLIFISTSNACSEHITTESSDIVCVKSSGGQEKHCKVTKTVNLVLYPHSMDSCISLKSKSGVIVGSLKFGLTDVREECMRSGFYHSFPGSPIIHSVMNCPHTGFCSDDYCSAIKPSDNVDDSSLINKKIGVTKCVRSCGSWFCGCWIPGDSCVKFRHAYDNIHNVDYEVTKCETWKTIFEITSEIIDHGEKPRKSTKNVYLGMNSQIANGVKMSVSSTASALDVGKTYSFIKSDEGIFSCNKVNSPGQYSPLYFGYIQCPTSDSSKTASTNCITDDRNFVGFVEDNKVNDRSYEFNYESWKKQNCKTFPYMEDGFLFNWDTNGYHRHIIDDRVYTLSVELNDYDIVIEDDDVECEVKFVSMEGCYDCQTGSTITIMASSTIDNTLLHINCESGPSTTLTIASDAKKYTLDMLFHKANIDEHCRTFCGTKEGSINIKGSLVFVGFTKFVGESDNVFSSITDSVWSWRNPLFSMLSSKFNYFGYIIIIILTMIILMVLLNLIKSIRMIIYHIKND